MSVEFQVPSLRIQIRERLNEKESKAIRLKALCELEEHRLASIMHLELEQWRWKAFVDRHRKGNEKMFGTGKLSGISSKTETELVLNEGLVL